MMTSGQQWKLLDYENRNFLRESTIRLGIDMTLLFRPNMVSDVIDYLLVLACQNDGIRTQCSNLAEVYSFFNWSLKRED